MDLEARQRLIDRLLPLYDAGDQRPAMTLDEFFDGNSDEASLGGGHLNPDHPGLDVYRDVLGRIQRLSNVQGVYLEVAEVPDQEDEDEDDMWVTAIRAVVLTDAPQTDVVDWLSQLRPRDVWDESDVVIEGDLLRPAGVRLPHAPGLLRPGMRAVWVDIR